MSLEDSKKIDEEVREMLAEKPADNLSEKTEAEITQEFLDEYQKLCLKYQRDFQQMPPQIIKIEVFKKE